MTVRLSYINKLRGLEHVFKISGLGLESPEKQTVQGHAKLNLAKNKGDEVKYEAHLQVHENFGEVGAILVTNEHRKEIYLKDIVLDGLPQGPVKFYCNSWIASKHDNPEKRIFFTTKVNM